MAAAERTGSLRERAGRKFTAFLALAGYLYVCLGALMFLKSTILQDVGISFTAWGVAAFKALLLAKFMLLGEALHIGDAHKHRPLIWPTLYKSVVFLVFLLILTVLEECLVGLYRGRSLAGSVAQAVGPTFPHGLATSLIMLLILVPYFALRSLGEVFGDGLLLRLFFANRRALG